VEHSRGFGELLSCETARDAARLRRRRGARCGIVAIALVTVSATARGGAEPRGVSLADLPPLPLVDSGEPEGQGLALASATRIDEDVVTGAAKREQSLGNVASAVTVISGDRLRRFGYRTVAEALRAVAGIYVGDDRELARPGFRGMQIVGDWNTRILVLVDGATINDAWSLLGGIDYNTPISVDEIARVEVIRGPVSSVYGASAFFGIVNIVTRDATDSPRVWARSSASDFGTAGLAAGFAAGGLDRQLRGMVSVTQRHGESFYVPEFGRQLDVDGIDGYMASLVGRLHGAFAQARLYRRMRQFVFAPWNSEIGNPENRIWDNGGIAEAGYTHDLGGVTTTARTYGGYYQFSDSLIYPDGKFRNFGGGVWLGAELRGHRTFFDDRLELTAGAEALKAATWNESYFTGMEADKLSVPKSYNMEATYAEANARPADWISITAGGRFDRSSLFENRFSPRAAVLLDRDETAGIKLLYAEGFRNPTIWESFFTDGVIYQPNPHILPERIRSEEAVLWSRPRPGLSLRASLFRWNADRLIEQTPVDVDGTMKITFVNHSTRESRGLELEAQFRNSDGWLVAGGGCYAEVKDPATDGRVLNAPAWTATAAISTPKIMGIAHLSTELDYVGSRHTLDPMRDAAAFVGWNATLQVPSVHGVDVLLGVRNILGVRPDEVTSTDYDRTDSNVSFSTVPGEGREIYARIGYQY